MSRKTAKAVRKIVPVSSPPPPNSTTRRVAPRVTAPSVLSAEEKVVAAVVPPEDAVLIQRKLLKKRLYSPELAFGQSGLPYQTYPYAKGPDLANDGIGYGEIISVDVCQLVGCVELLEESEKPPPRLNIAKGFSRRTRSGRQVIDNTDPGVLNKK